MNKSSDKNIRGKHKPETKRITEMGNSVTRHVKEFYERWVSAAKKRSTATPQRQE